MSTGATFGKVAAFIAVPLAIGSCCGGGLLVFGTIAAALGAVGNWAMSLGGVAVVLMGVAGLLLFRALRRRQTCDIDQETVVENRSV